MIHERLQEHKGINGKFKNDDFQMICIRQYGAKEVEGSPYSNMRDLLVSKEVTAHSLVDKGITNLKSHAGDAFGLRIPINILNHAESEPERTSLLNDINLALEKRQFVKLSGEYKCKGTNCSGKFTTFAGYFLHYVRVHTGLAHLLPSTEKQPRVLCPRCGRYFSSASVLRDHLTAFPHYLEIDEANLEAGLYIKRSLEVMKGYDLKNVRNGTDAASRSSITEKRTRQ